MEKKIGWRCWWKVVVTIKPKRAEELRPASLAEPAPFMTPSEPRSRGDRASSASDLHKRSRGHWPTCKGDRHRQSTGAKIEPLTINITKNPVIQRSNKVGRPCGPAMAYT